MYANVKSFSLFGSSVVERDDGCTSRLALGQAVDMWANESIDLFIGPPCTIGKST